MADMILRAGQFEFAFPRPALVMGIVNVTPDSFFDGGRFLDAPAAVAHALQLVEIFESLVSCGEFGGDPFLHGVMIGRQHNSIGG